MRRLALLVLLAVPVAGCGDGSDAVGRAVATPTATPHFSPQALATATATPTAPPHVGRYLVAAVRRPAQLRATPNGRVLARVTAKTEFGSPTSLAVVGRRPGWLRVLSPALQNGRRGWIPAASAELQSTDWVIRVDRSARRVRVSNGKRTVLSFSVATGRPGNETPLGRFAVTDKLRPADPGSPYGCCAVALTGHQPRLVAGWPGGDRLAIHNTPAVASVGQAASLGCLRADRKPMRALMRRLPLGTPVFIRA